MVSTSSSRPFSLLQLSNFPAVDQSFSQRSSSPVTSHYRPFSTYLADSPSPTSIISPSKPRRPPSLGGLSSFGSMGFSFKDKSKDKHQSRPRKTSNPVESAEVSTVRPSLPSMAMSSFSRPKKRPSTSHGRFTIPKVAKKRSLASLLSATHSEGTSPISSLSSASPAAGLSYLPGTSSPLAASPKKAKDASVNYRTRTEVAVKVNPGPTNKFVRKHSWLTRYNMKVHPYPFDATYMQAYDSISLENDRYSDILLRRLNPTTPSFHEHGRRPPLYTLDLGCGPGHWLLEAASIWDNSQLTGFDLVDVTLPGIKEADNISFVQGNFLRYPLPFPDKRFDFVRMANLSLCIPYDKWEFVLSEVQRVLTIEGRFELIDDQIFFPYAPVSASDPAVPSSKLVPMGQPVSLFDLDDDDNESDENTLEGDDLADKHSFETEATLISEGDASSLGPHEQLKQPLTQKHSPPSRSLSHVSVPTSAGDPDTPVPAIAIVAMEASTTFRPSPWSQEAAASRNVETVFEDMLFKKYGIHPRPSEFALDMLQHVFGMDNAKQVKNFQVKLAPNDAPTAFASSRWGSVEGGSDKEASSPESTLTAMINGVKKPWLTVEWEKKREKKAKRDVLSGDSRQSEESFLATQIPEGISAKAAGRLGIANTVEQRISDEAPKKAFQSTPKVSAKAAGRLGISYSGLAAATVASTRPAQSSTPSLDLNPSVTTQSPGLIIWPSTFIQLSPLELEMHACRYVHTLLGCKPALAEFVETFTDEKGVRLADDEAFQEAIWQYECFRRQRFNWPSELPDSNLNSIENSPYDDDPTLRSATFQIPVGSNLDLSTSGESSGPSSNPYSRDELTHVRTIRVFEAVKTDDYTFASLQFPRSAPSPPSKH